MIIKNTPKKHFVVINADVIRNKQLSLKSLGLLTMLLSLPESWRVNVDALSRHFTQEGCFAIRSALKELMCAGYVKSIKHRNASGQITSRDYAVSDAVIQDVLHQPVPVSRSEPQPVNAAVKARHKKRDPHLKKHDDGITAACLTDEDATIGDTLTRNQLHFLTREATKLFDKSGATDLAQFTQVLTFVIQSPEQFNRAHPSFIKKFNAVAKVICQGRWMTPAEFFQQKQAQSRQRAAPFQHTIQVCAQDEQHWKKLLQMPATRQNQRLRAHIQAQLEIARTTKQDAIRAYDADLSTCSEARVS